MEPLQLLDSFGPQTGSSDNVDVGTGVLITSGIEILGVLNGKSVVGTVVIDPFALCASAVQRGPRRRRQTENPEPVIAFLFAPNMTGEL